MAVDFSIHDFLYPLSIIRLHHFFEKSQWFSEDRLKEYQLRRLKIIVRHAYDNVPYYGDLFKKIKLSPDDIKSQADLKKIPPLDKKNIRNNFDILVAKHAKRFRPSLCRTTGTSGRPVEFYHDKFSNILEFCYYWRFWSWAGYSLGMPFADLTLAHFLSRRFEDIADFSRLTNRLCLNVSWLSHNNTDQFVKLIRRYRCLFLKGTPSSIYIFAILVEKRKDCHLVFKAIFTSGELLLPHQRKKIEDVFRCKVFDSYGHMEQTVAICQCPYGNYHINADYGIFELEKDDKLSNVNKSVGSVIGTTLYNFAMPLIRYRVNDLVEVSEKGNQCACGRGLPLCAGIAGRIQDIIVTPDKRYLTNVFIALNVIEGALWSQIVQTDSDRLSVRIIKGDDFAVRKQEVLVEQLRGLTGGSMNITVEYLPRDMLTELSSKKYRPVVSCITPFE